MNREEALQIHLTVCEELHALVLDENRFLKQNRCAPDFGLTERKRKLLDRLDTSLKLVKDHPANIHESQIAKELSSRTRARILQILHLDKENEQLLLHTSLRPKLDGSSTQPPPSRLSQLYGGIRNTPLSES